MEVGVMNILKTNKSLDNTYPNRLEVNIDNFKHNINEIKKIIDR